MFVRGFPDFRKSCLVYFVLEWFSIASASKIIRFYFGFLLLRSYRCYWLAYRKFPVISPGLTFVQNAFCWAYFRGSLFSEGLIIGGNFAFQNDLGLAIKTA